MGSNRRSDFRGGRDLVTYQLGYHACNNSCALIHQLLDVETKSRKRSRLLIHRIKPNEESSRERHHHIYIELRWTSVLGDDRWLAGFPIAEDYRREGAFGALGDGGGEGQEPTASPWVAVEEEEVGGAKELGTCMFASGEVRLGDDGHVEASGEAANDQR